MRNYTDFFCNSLTQVLLSFNGVDYARISNSTFCDVAPLQWPLASSASFPYGRPGDINYIDRTYCAPFRYVPMWTLLSIEPPLGPEYGGTVIGLIGNEFLTNAGISSCIFRDPSIDRRVSGPASTVITGKLNTTSGSNGTCISRDLPLQRPKAIIYDNNLEVCLQQRPYNAECNRMAKVECNGLILNSSEPQLDFVPGYRRSVCLPPNLACQWDPFDPTTSQLACIKQALPPEMAAAAGRPDPDQPVVHSRDIFVSMDREHWSIAPASSVECSLQGVTQISSGFQVCRVEAVRRSVFNFYERPNVTNIHADVGPFNDSTIVTIIGEGFQNNPRLAVLFTPRSMDTAEATAGGWAIGVLAENVTFVDPFTVVASSPVCSWAESLISPSRQMITVDARIALNGLDFTQEPLPFYYVNMWTVDAVIPWKGRMTGGTSVTVYGPFFRFTRELTCRFGEFAATAATFLTTTSVICRTPSVVGHGRMSVEVLPY
jgi:hypothetical protein